jgi:hypothetical protein
MLLYSSTQLDADEAFAALQKRLEANPQDMVFVDAMAATLKSVHTAVKENQPVITEAFGATRMLDLVKDVSLALDEKVRRTTCPPTAHGLAARPY